MLSIERDEAGAGGAEFNKGLESDRGICSEDADVVAVAEEACLSFGGLEFWDEVVLVNGDGVPKVRSESGVEGLVDEAAEGEVVLGQVVGYELC